MTTISKNKKRVNLLDLVIMVIVLVFIIALVFGVGRLAGVQNKAQGTISGRVTYSVEIKQQDKALLDFLEVGQQLKDGTNKQIMGTIVEIYDEPSEKEVENHADKTITLAKIPNKIDVILEIESEAEMTGPDINVGSFVLKIGKALHCNVGDAAASGTSTGAWYHIKLVLGSAQTQARGGMNQKKFNFFH
ncbi:MAG: DUF4330 domain-containing protein, partial [Clostridia bacterium]|nr:DUF4330 domain-containing protein [Clostridia bacterium]